MELFSLAGKVAVVTGSGVGIGRATAIAMAEAGADIVVAEINPQTAASTAAEIRAKGRKALELHTDVLNSAHVKDMVQQTVKKYGRIDILVNNAGGVKNPEPILGMSESTWDSVFDLNMKSTFLCCREAGQVMVDKHIRGSIINLSSLAGFASRPGVVHYGAAKGAVRQFTEGLAKEWGPYGIRVNAIAPGSIRTQLVATMHQGEPDVFDRRLKMIPLGRHGDPADIASVAVFLASDAAGYVTGQTIVVSGGRDSVVDPPA